MRKSTIARVALNIPENPAQFCSYGQHKIECFTGNTDLSKPNPTIADVTSHFAALATADGQATNNEPGAIELRDQCYETCENDMEQWALYARTTALQNPARGAQILQSSGFDEKKPSGRRKGDFEVTFPSVGVAHAYIKAVARGASYEWQISLDGGVTYVAAGTTTRADQLFTGLKKGTDYYVRWKTTVGRTMTDWSQGARFMQAK